MPTVEELQEKIKSLQADVKRYVKTGRQAEAEVKWEEVQRLQRKLEKEEAKLPTHPAWVPLPPLSHSCYGYLVAE